MDGECESLYIVSPYTCPSIVSLFSLMLHNSFFYYFLSVWRSFFSQIYKGRSASNKFFFFSPTENFFMCCLFPKGSFCQKLNLWLAVLYFCHLKKILCQFLLGSKVSDEKFADIWNGIHIGNVLFLIRFFHSFSLCFIFKSLIIVCIGVGFFVFTLLGSFFSFSGMCVRLFFIAGKSSAIIPSNIISVSLFALSFWYSKMMNIGLFGFAPQIPEALFNSFFFFSIVSLCCFRLGKLYDLPQVQVHWFFFVVFVYFSFQITSSLILSYVFSTQLLRSFSEFCCDFYYCSFHFYNSRLVLFM